MPHVFGGRSHQKRLLRSGSILHYRQVWWRSKSKSKFDAHQRRGKRSPAFGGWESLITRTHAQTHCFRVRLTRDVRDYAACWRNRAWVNMTRQGLLCCCLPQHLRTNRMWPMNAFLPYGFTASLTSCYYVPCPTDQLSTRKPVHCNFLPLVYHLLLHIC